MNVFPQPADIVKAFSENAFTPTRGKGFAVATPEGVGCCALGALALCMANKGTLLLAVEEPDLEYRRLNVEMLVGDHLGALGNRCWRAGVIDGFDGNPSGHGAFSSCSDYFEGYATGYESYWTLCAGVPA